MTASTNSESRQLQTSLGRLQKPFDKSKTWRPLFGQREVAARAKLECRRLLSLMWAQVDQKTISCLF
jgi:hypothetical protein